MTVPARAVLFVRYDRTAQDRATYRRLKAHARREGYAHLSDWVRRTLMAELKAGPYIHGARVSALDDKK